MTATKDANNDKPRIIRPFGNLECYEFHMLQLRFLGSTIVNCRYSIPPSLAAPEHRDLVVARVEEAIARVVLEHAALRVDVVRADTRRPAWVAVDRIDLAHHLLWEDVDAADAEYGEILRDRIERRLDEPYGASLAGRPWWRVLVLFRAAGRRRRRPPSLDVIFDYSHGLGDGTSGKIFHETLLRALNLGAAPGTGRTETEADPVLVGRVLRVPAAASPLPPPAEKAARFPVSAGFALRTAWRELRPPGLFPTTTAAQARWAPIRAAPAPYRTRFRAFDVGPAALRALVAACRARRTTVTGLLHALLLASAAARVPARDAAAFAGSTALDLRRHLPGGRRGAMANYVSLTTHEFGADVVRRVRDAAASASASASASVSATERGGEPPPPLVDVVWECAARVRAEIQARLDRGLRNDLVGLMKFVPDWRAQLRDEAAKPRPHSFVVTNLGVVDGGPRAEVEAEAEAEVEADGPTGEGEEGWGIEHSVFAVSAEVCGAAFQAAPISVRGGALCVSCSWQDGVVDVRLAEAIVADLERWLRFLGTS